MNAFIPLITVFNFSLRNIFPGRTANYIGLDNYREVIRSEVFQSALQRTLLFSLECLVIEIPLGILIASLIPKKGKVGALCSAFFSAPLLVPLMVSGLNGRLLFRADVGPLAYMFSKVTGFNYTLNNPTMAFHTLVFIDVWHWTSLIVILMYSGIRSIPEELYQAASIDRASGITIFRAVTLPSLRYPTLIACLLRFMDSFRFFDEAWIMTGGGPGTATEFLSIYTQREALQAFRYGTAGAVSLIYLFITMIICYMLFKVFQRG